MLQMNSLIIEGKIKKAAFVEGDVCSAKFTIENETTYNVSCFDCELYGSFAEKIYPKLKEGQIVRIVGQLREKRSEENGKIVSQVYVLCEHIEFRKKTEKAS